MIKKSITPLISPTELKSLLAKRNVRLIDARVGANIKTIFSNQHLLGAQHVDLEQDMADIKTNAADGGRHPLPNIQAFTTLLGVLGMGKKSHIVVYDDKNGSNAAARFWWLMKALGHEKIQVLDGGFQGALAAQMPTSDKLKQYKCLSPYPATEWQLPLSNLAEVEAITQNPNYTVIDVRSSERYRGETEPIDLIAGHIPGAINIPFTENLKSDGFFLEKSALEAKYAPIFKEKPLDSIIVHCGSGVTACHTLLAMAQAGYEIPKLYVGSWSEWSRNDKVIAVGEK
jgi:thiosulfate/3-mercaptopyruvate sulfurtransferase